MLSPEMMRKIPETYFISFVHRGPSGEEAWGFDNIMLNTPLIDTPERLESVTLQVSEERGVQGVVILNLVKLHSTTTIDLRPTRLRSVTAI